MPFANSIRPRGPFTLSKRSSVEKWAIPSLRKSPLGPLAGVRMFPHHWCALSCAVTRNVASVLASFLVRNPMFSLNVMLVPKPCA